MRDHFQVYEYVGVPSEEIYAIPPYENYMYTTAIIPADASPESVVSPRPARLNDAEEIDTSSMKTFGEEGGVHKQFSDNSLISQFAQ